MGGRFARTDLFELCHNLVSIITEDMDNIPYKHEIHRNNRTNNLVYRFTDKNGPRCYININCKTLTIDIDIEIKGEFMATVDITKSRNTYIKRPESPVPHFFKRIDDAIISYKAELMECSRDRVVEYLPA